MKNLNRGMFFKYCFLLLFVFPIYSIEKEKSFVIVIPSYNNKEWFRYNLNSVFSQKYENYRVVYVDDCSTDKTYKYVKRYLKKRKHRTKVTLKRNKNRQGALANYYNVILSCSSEEIIVCLDGDDWLANENVLSKLNDVYNSEDVWLTYGQLTSWSHDDFFKCKCLPEEVIQKKSYRKHPWVTSHLKSFYAWLFQRIEIKDLRYRDNFFSMCSDLAMMFPMLEMAGKHSKFIHDVLYVYNIQNSQNDFKLDRNFQIHLEEVLRYRPQYDVLKEFVVVIPSYNNEKWFKYNLDSVFSQFYPVFRLEYIDDCSTDKTFKKVTQYLNKIDTHHHIKLTENNIRVGALANHYKAIQECKDNEIIVSLDGDDWFSDEYVLDHLNRVYQDPKVWLTYGQFCNWPTGEIGWCENYSETAVKKNDFRKFGFVAAQPRTYYGWLAKKIQKVDLLDEDNKFYSVAGDVALMFPMLEMAGDRFKFIPEILTQRNVATELNDFKIHSDLQLETTEKIAQKNKYTRLEIDLS